MTVESTVAAEQQRTFARLNLRELMPSIFRPGSDPDGTDETLLEQSLLENDDKLRHALPLEDASAPDIPRRERPALTPRRVSAIGGLTFVGLLAPGLVAPTPVNAQSGLSPPQITVPRVKGMVYLMAQADCRQRLRETIRLNPGVDINSGKCTVPEKFIKNCRVGPLGKADADPPLRRSEGFCTAAYHLHIKDFTTPELPGIFSSNIDAICTSYRQGVRLVPYFPRGRDGRIQVRWRTDPDPGKTVKFICRMV